MLLKNVTSLRAVNVLTENPTFQFKLIAFLDVNVRTKGAGRPFSTFEQ